MFEQAERLDLHLNFPNDLKFLISSNCVNREKVDDKNVQPSLKSLSCAEALLSACDMDEPVMVKNSSEDGSLFKSPCASAAAYMSTGNPEILKYLESVIQNFPCGDFQPFFDQDPSRNFDLDPSRNRGQPCHPGRRNSTRIHDLEFDQDPSRNFDLDLGPGIRPGS
ncbi:hypothetical protein AgCh_027867 [Apium graveolens]